MAEVNLVIDELKLDDIQIKVLWYLALLPCTMNRSLNASTGM
jgi:hypothetical protein